MSDITLEAWDALLRRVALMEANIERAAQEIARLRYALSLAASVDDVLPGQVRIGNQVLPAGMLGGCVSSGEGE